MSTFTHPQNLVAEANRYRLIWGAVCPYAHRAKIGHELLGLQDIISVGATDPVRSEHGWAFSLDQEGVDPILKVSYLKDSYLLTDNNYQGPYSVPVLVDTTTNKIVNKESADILRAFSTIFKPFHKAQAPDLYPSALHQEIDEWNERIAYAINDGIYRIGFAKTQQDYEQACQIFFDMMALLDERMQTRQFFHGEQLTETDIRLYTTLIRFDAVYYVLYKANYKRLIDYPHLFAYIKRLYHIPGFGSTTDFDSIKRGYYLGSDAQAIVPMGPDESIWTN